MYITFCTLDWYRISYKTARGLVIAMSSIPIKITAGKCMDLSLNSFGAVSALHIFPSRSLKMSRKKL